MVQRPRGTRDFLPDEMEKRRHYEAALRRVAKTFGFREVATPIFEESELFTLKSGPNVLDELYVFKDKGNREIALRPEMTAPTIRMFVNEMSNNPKPIKVFYFGQCFRYERPQSGRYREFFQFGAELIGNFDAESDAEIIAMASSMIKVFGLKNYIIKIGHIGILKQKVISAGVPEKCVVGVLQKLDKKLYDEARLLLLEMGVSEENIRGIFEFTETVGGVDVLSRVPGETGDYLRRVFDLLLAMGVGNVVIDLGVVRGLDYYTGIVFEVEAPTLGAEKQICGGGAYSLSELFGGERVFSTGFAVGFDRAIIAAEKEGLVCESESIKVYVLPTSKDMQIYASRVVANLRAADIVSDIEIMGRRVSKAMKYASAIGAEYVVIVGAQEIQQDSVMLRNMVSGEQKLVKISNLIEEIQ
ncbi:MAG: histidine--tRNA ligase [archaeon]|nr:histidine--tRNA ligase [archaeon]